MQREIKFRGKRTDNGEWVYGSLIQDNDSIYILPFDNGIWINYIPKEDESYYQQMRVMVHTVIPETVGQFTGLLDKDGTEIYKGDVVKIYDLLAEVRWSDKWASCIFYCKTQKGVEDLPFSNGTSLNSDDCEVIGNIHSNPELTA